MYRESIATDIQVFLKQKLPTLYLTVQCSTYFQLGESESKFIKQFCMLNTCSEIQVLTKLVDETIILAVWILYRITCHSYSPDHYQNQYRMHCANFVF